MMPYKTFAFIRIPMVNDYLKCGWIPRDSLSGTNHGNYSVLMEWLECACGKLMPQPNQRVR